MRHLALSYGVEAIYMPELANGQQYYFAALRRLLKEGRLQPSDMVGYLSSGKGRNKDLIPRNQCSGRCFEACRGDCIT